MRISGIQWLPGSGFCHCLPFGDLTATPVRCPSVAPFFRRLFAAGNETLLTLALMLGRLFMDVMERVLVDSLEPASCMSVDLGMVFIEGSLPFFTSTVIERVGSQAAASSTKLHQRSIPRVTGTDRASQLKLACRIYGNTMT